jgi:hypothetical protein
MEEKTKQQQGSAQAKARNEVGTASDGKPTGAAVDAPLSADVRIAVVEGAPLAPTQPSASPAPQTADAAVRAPSRSIYSPVSPCPTECAHRSPFSPCIAAGGHWCPCGYKRPYSSHATCCSNVLHHAAHSGAQKPWCPSTFEQRKRLCCVSTIYALLTFYYFSYRPRRFAARKCHFALRRASMMGCSTSPECESALDSD